MIKTIVTWVIIFVIVGIILSFIGSSSGSNLWNEMENKISAPSNNNIEAGYRDVDGNWISYSISKQDVLNGVQIFPYIDRIYGLDKCSLIDAAANINGNHIANLEKLTCQNFCGTKNMNYYSYDCKYDKLYCSCKK